MKHLFTALALALLLVCAIVPIPATAGNPCVVNCPSMSPGCYAFALVRCTGGWVDGSVIWMWEVIDPEQEPEPEVTSLATLPDDHFQVFGDTPKSQHPWGGDEVIISEPLR